MAEKSGKNIAEVLDEFLAAQRERLSAKTFAQYESIVDLFRSYLQSYWPGHDGEYSEEPGKTYVERFGPEEIPGGFSEFLGYFMPRKVYAGQDTMRAAGTVTRKLAQWLAEQGYIEKEPEVAKSVARKGRSLSKSKKAERILDKFVAGLSLTVEESSLIEDHLIVERVEPGRLWVKPLLEGNEVLGPISVPTEATDLLEPLNDIGGAVGKRGGKWYLVEVWSVSPGFA